MASAAIRGREGSAAKPLLGVGGAVAGVGGQPAAMAAKGGPQLEPLHVIGVQTETPVAWSHDGDRLAFVNGSRSICILEHSEPDALNRALFHVVRMLPGHTSKVNVLTFHPTDANVIVSGGVEGLFVWDISSGKQTYKHPVAPFKNEHESDVECLCWAYGGEVLLSGSKDTNVKVWDVAEGYKCLETITGHKSGVMAVAFDPASDIIATAGRDSAIKLWQFGSVAPAVRAKRKQDKSIKCDLRANLSGHRGDVQCLQFFYDGRVLVSGARDNTMIVWDTLTNEKLREVTDARNVQGRHRGDVREILPIGLHMGTSDEPAHCLSCSMDSTLKLWELAPPPAIEKILNLDEAERHREETEKLLLEQILGGETGPIAALDAKETVSDTLMASNVAFVDEGAYRMAYNPKLPILAVSSSASAVQLVFLQRLDKTKLAQRTASHVLQEFRGHLSTVHEAELVDDTVLITASEDYNIHQYNIGNAARPASFKFGSSVLCLTYRRAEGKQRGYIVAGGADYVIRAFAMDPAECADVTGEGRPTKTVEPWEYVSAQFTGHAGRVTTIAVHPAGKIMATGAHDFNIFLWKLDDSYPKLSWRNGREQSGIPTGRPLAKVDAHKGHVHCLRFSFTGSSSFLASCANDHALKVWKLKQGRFTSTGLQEVWTAAEAHESVVSAVCWGKGASSNLVYSAGWDRKLKVWDAGAAKASVAPVAVLEGHTARITDIDSSTTGEFVVTVSTDESAIVWAAASPFAALARVKISSNEGWLSAVSVGTELFVTASEYGQIAVWPLDPTGQHSESFQALKDTDDAMKPTVATLPGLVLRGAAGGAGGGAGAGAMGGRAVPPMQPPAPKPAAAAAAAAAAPVTAVTPTGVEVAGGEATA